MHIHTQPWSGPSPEAGFCKDLPQGSLSHSLISCFPMGGSARRDEHGRGVVAATSSQGERRWQRGAAKANSAGPAGTRPASAQATLPRWHCQHPALGRPADPHRHLPHVPDPFLWSHPSHSCTDLMRNTRFQTEKAQLCPASLCPRRAPRPAPVSAEGHGGSRSDCHSSGHLTERGQSCKPLHETGGTDTFEQTNRSKK